METETGLKRCDCARGKALVKAAQLKPSLNPVISEQTATMCAEMMAGIPFFPSEAGPRSVIANEIASMCNSDEQAAWLAMRMNRLCYHRWPGLNEMRHVFWAKAQPRDGIEAEGISEVYPDGIPSETKKQDPALLEGPKRRLLGPVSADAEMAGAVASLVPAKNLNAVRGLPIKPGIILPGETEDGALQRTIEEEREKREQAHRPFAASPAMIADIKRRQLEAASPETRAILTGEAAKRRALPLAAELTGSDPDFTGDLSTEEYIREIRGDERRALDDAAKAEMGEGTCEAKEVQA